MIIIHTFFDLSRKINEMFAPLMKAGALYGKNSSAAEEAEIAIALDPKGGPNLRLSDMRLPLWAIIARKHSHALGRLDEKGRVIFTGPKGLLPAYYEAAEITGGDKAFLKTVADQDGKAFNYRSFITSKQFSMLPVEIELDFQKIRKR
jgi:hypothetical protein